MVDSQEPERELKIASAPPIPNYEKLTQQTNENRRGKILQTINKSLAAQGVNIFDLRRQNDQQVLEEEEVKNMESFLSSSESERLNFC